MQFPILDDERGHVVCAGVMPKRGETRRELSGESAVPSRQGSEGSFREELGHKRFHQS